MIKYFYFRNVLLINHDKRMYLIVLHKDYYLAIQKIYLSFSIWMNFITVGLNKKAHGCNHTRLDAHHAPTQCLIINLLWILSYVWISTTTLCV